MIISMTEESLRNDEIGIGMSVHKFFTSTGDGGLYGSRAYINAQDDGHEYHTAYPLCIFIDVLVVLEAFMTNEQEHVVM